MDKMDDNKTVEVPSETLQNDKVKDTGDVRLEDASPQVPEKEVTEIPKVVDAAAKEDDKAGADAKNYPGGERFDASTLPESNDADEIRKQVEFYFSDSNLPTDKYLWTMVSENKGWADLQKIATFKRMRRFKPYSAVVEALRSSTFLDVDESGEKVKRKEELRPWNAATTPILRSVYVKGFPEETKSMQVELEKFFAGFGDAKVVRMRRTDDGKFKGSVFVEFASTEQQSAFLALEGDSAPKYENIKLESMSKKAYVTMKEEQYGGQFPANRKSKTRFNAFQEQKKNQPANRRGGKSGRGRGGHESRGSTRPNDRNDERTRQAGDAATAQGEKRVHPDEGQSEQVAKQVKLDTTEQS